MPSKRQVFFKPPGGQVHEFLLMMRIAHGVIAVFLVNQSFGFQSLGIQFKGIGKRNDRIFISMEYEEMVDIVNFVPEIKKQGGFIKGLY